MLYVFEPAALHHVIVKEQHVFEEAAWFLKWVVSAHFIGLICLTDTVLEGSTTSASVLGYWQPWVCSIHDIEGTRSWRTIQATTIGSSARC